MTGAVPIGGTAGLEVIRLSTVEARRQRRVADALTVTLR
jgi:hypothetical protein